MHAGMRVQVDVAPFVLGNLGCVGTEAALLDCPAADERSRRTTCDPQSNDYAYIACGTLSTPGVSYCACEYSPSLTWSLVPFRRP